MEYVRNKGSERRIKLMIYALNTKQQELYLGGNFELHKSSCSYYINSNNKFSFYEIGPFSNDYEALAYAKKLFPDKAQKIDGCKYCCPEIHKG